MFNFCLSFIIQQWILDVSYNITHGHYLLNTLKAISGIFVVVPFFLTVWYGGPIVACVITVIPILMLIGYSGYIYFYPRPVPPQPTLSAQPGPVPPQPGPGELEDGTRSVGVILPENMEGCEAVLGDGSGGSDGLAPSGGSVEVAGETAE